MKLLLTAFAFTLASGAAVADSVETGTIVWDAGIVATDGASNRQIREIHLAFSSIERNANGDVIHVGEPNTRRHILGNGRRNSTTFRDLDLPTGEYILHQVAFRDGYQSFCLLEKTLLVDVEAGETQYLGQLQLNEPSGSPTLDAAVYVPIHGMAFDLETAQQSPHWRYGDAKATKIEQISIDPEYGECGASAVNVAAW